MGWAELGNVAYTLIVGGVGSTIALFGIISSRFGDRLFDHALNRKMETFKHGLEMEIEELRAHLGRLSDRGIRSNEREYNAIVAAWEGYVEAFLATMTCIARFDEHADLSKMDDTEFDEWAKSIDLRPSDAKAIRESKDRNRLFGRYLQLKAINNALKSNFDARLAVRKQGIFMPRQLEEQFTVAINELSMVHAAQRADFDSRSTKLSTEATGSFMENGPTIYDALKDAARARLMYDEARPQAG